MGGALEQMPIDMQKAYCESIDELAEQCGDNDNKLTEDMENAEFG